MNICIALSRFFPRHYGGMINDAHDVAQAMRQRGHYVWILCTEEESNPDGGVISEEVHNGLPVVRIWLGNLELDADNRLVGFDRRMGQVVKSVLLKQQADLLHVWNFATLSTSVVPAAHEIGVPVVYKATDYGATCWRYLLVRWDGSLCDGREDLMHCLDCFRPWSSRSDLAFRLLQGLSEPARSWLLDLASHIRGPKPWIIDRAMKLRRRFQEHRPALLSVDLVIAPSRWMKQVLVMNGLAEEKVVISFYGLRQPPPDRLQKVPSPVIRFGYMGRIHPSKGVEQVVEAFTRLPDPQGATLSIFGVPTVQDEFAYAGKVWALTGGNTRVRLRPLFSPEQLSETLQQIDVLVVPSMWYENSSIVILEALAHRTPVIVSDVAGNRDHVRHNHNGLVFPRGDVDALTQQMQRCVSEPRLLERLAANTGVVEFIEEQAEELEGYYTALLESYKERGAS